MHIRTLQRLVEGRVPAQLVSEIVEEVAKRLRGKTYDWPLDAFRLQVQGWTNKIGTLWAKSDRQAFHIPTADVPTRVPAGLEKSTIDAGFRGAIEGYDFRKFMVAALVERFFPALGALVLVGFVVVEATGPLLSSGGAFPVGEPTPPKVV